MTENELRIFKQELRAMGLRTRGLGAIQTIWYGGKRIEYMHSYQSLKSCKLGIEKLLDLTEAKLTGNIMEKSTMSKV
jgi:hypothetical protein